MREPVPIRRGDPLLADHLPELREVRVGEPRGGQPNPVDVRDREEVRVRKLQDLAQQREQGGL